MNKTINVNFPLKDLNISPLSMAKYLYQKGIFSHLVIQKLIYLAFLEGLKSDLLFFSERFQAWKYGPVLRSVFEPITNCSNLDEMFVEVPELKNKKIINLLEVTYQTYHNWDTWDLVDKSHIGPWQKTRGNLSPEEISTQEIDLKDLISFANGQK